LGIDLFLVLAASLLALALRENFELTSAKVIAFLPYLACTFASAAVVIPLLALPRSVWRFSTITDYLHLAVATLVIVLAAVVMGFVINRLEGVARSIPVLQAITLLMFLVGARVYMRIRHAARRDPIKQFSMAPGPKGLQRSSILIIGINRLTELFLQSAQELSGDGVHVAGLIGTNARHTGRLMHRLPILGTPEQLPEILRQQQVLGILIDRIVVTDRVSSLKPETKARLLELQTSSDIRIDFLAASLGLEPAESRTEFHDTESDATSPGSTPKNVLMISDHERVALSGRPFWRVKRGLDIIGALVLLILLAPAIAVVTALVLTDVGKPLLFRQQRPGLGRRPFKVHKFRTMGAAYDEKGKIVPDHARLSAIGRILRRTRLDELPQLVNILVGEMSFVGPRPLLPVDQIEGSEGRLLVRPGLTGWAQVKGGRHLSAADKAALDIWYVRNASLAVDCEVIVRTVGMILFGDKQNDEAVRRAWDDVRKAQYGAATSFAGEVNGGAAPTVERRVA
jgi:lipopolysaccharide/colanic/teichoic acid biosynthesis glycosyltransferase